MYVVVVFVLALLSPLPFASPFVLLSDHIVQDATFQSSIQHIFFGTPPFEITSNLTISPFGIIQNGTNGFDSIKMCKHIQNRQFHICWMVDITYVKPSSYYYSICNFSYGKHAVNCTI